ncbi:MAG: mandelate racemase/muconate lactonizing enzyme family protein [Candidatus Lambdaproteobacteria bacterium]|nr:mandelate racemase/muconate lactonizing enzyme family protein [Candidatus Lambdaproteobacteria bacterium]
MKITKVGATWLRIPHPPDRVQVSDFGRLDSINTCLVRIETDAGLTGFGEAKATVGSGGDHSTLVTLISRELAPVLVGQEPRDISRLWELMYNGPRAHHALARGRAFPVLGRRGVTLTAVSGVDQALWDLLGKSLGVPVYRLLGGACRNRMRAYASGGWADEHAIGGQLLGYVKEGGFRAVKMRVGAMDGDVMTSVRRVRAAREALGEGVDIMVDAHGTFSVAEARRFCREVAECRLAWFEEPVSADNHAGMAEVRAATDIPIAAGESLFTRFDFLDLAQRRAADVFQPDMAICGGITEGMRIAALAGAFQLALAPHMAGGALMLAAGLHVAAAAPAGTIIEYFSGQRPLRLGMAREALTVQDGEIEIPDRPGLGVTIDEDFVRKYTVG